MHAAILPLSVALLSWFFATGAILWLDRRPPATWPGSLVGATAVAGAAFGVFLISMESSTVPAAYAAFAAMILLWGWHELSFLMGFVAGPRRQPCPADATGWRRFKLATATLIHHEVALAATALLLLVISWGQPNQVAAHGFLLLFVMRLSTKFNIFFGVPNFSDDMMPAHLDYLRSYFRKRRGNPLLPVSALLSVAVTLWLATLARAAAPGSGAAVGYQLLAALSLLGVVEHLFLLLPFRDSRLWTAIFARDTKPAPAGLQTQGLKGSDHGL